MLGLDCVDVIFFSLSVFYLCFLYGLHFRTVMHDDLPKSRLLNLLGVPLSTLLSQHPLPYVRRTAQYRDAGGLTLI